MTDPPYAPEVGRPYRKGGGYCCEGDTVETSVVVGELAPPTDGPLSVASFQTIRLREYHEVGPDGLPARHRTVQTIQSMVDGLATHIYAFDLSEARVERIEGGTPGHPYRIKGSLWAVELTLPRALMRGEEHTLEYVTTFRSDGPVEPRFRRATHRRIEDASISVKFHPDMLPEQIWWAQWADYREPNDRIVDRRPMALDHDNAVSHHLDVIERAVAGFVWEFPPL